MRRREFIAGLGSAAAWPVVARAQEAKRVGVLMGATTAEQQSHLTLFLQGLRKMGWIDGQNLRMEVRSSGADPRLMQAYATDLVDLFKPDVLLTATTGNLAALRRATGTIPIVFTNVSDPVGQGFVPSLAHPGGNITGFANPEFSIAGKWADLLKQMAPSIARVALVFNPETSPQSNLFVNALEAGAASLGIEAIAAPVHSTAEIEATLGRLSHEPNVGLIFPGSSFTGLRAQLIVETVARYRLPAIYAQDVHMSEGGLMQYHDDPSEPFRLAPLYVDRILKGTKPGELPVQLPTKFSLIINLKTAKALGLAVPETLLATADEVIQ